MSGYVKATAWNLKNSHFCLQTWLENGRVEAIFKIFSLRLNHNNMDVRFFRGSLTTFGLICRGNKEPIAEFNKIIKIRLPLRMRVCQMKKKS